MVAFNKRLRRYRVSGVVDEIASIKPMKMSSLVAFNNRFDLRYDKDNSGRTQIQLQHSTSVLRSCTIGNAEQNFLLHLPICMRADFLVRVLALLPRLGSAAFVTRFMCRLAAFLLWKPMASGKRKRQAARASRKRQTKQIHFYFRTTSTLAIITVVDIGLALHGVVIHRTKVALHFSQQ